MHTTANPTTWLEKATFKQMVQGDTTKNQKQWNLLPMLLVSDKHFLTLLPTPEPLILLPASTWDKTKETTVLVVALPRTYSQPVTNTLSLCKLQ